MPKKASIKVAKVKLSEKTVKVNWRKIFDALIKGGIKAAKKDYNNTFKELISLSGAFSFKDDPGDVAYNFLLSSLVNAAHDLASDNMSLFAAPIKEKVKPYDHPDYQAFLDEITDLIEDKEIYLDLQFFSDPRAYLLNHLPSFKDHFLKYLQLFGISEKEAQLITNRLPTYFVFAVNDYGRKNYTQYELLNNLLESKLNEAARRELEWEAYYSYLKQEIERPVFGEAFGLKSVYIPLRAYYEEKKKIDPREVIEQVHHRGESKKIAVDLEKNLDEWLANEKTEDEIKVISGGPGSGKSSFAKMWAAKIAETRSMRLLFVPLHLINYEDNIKRAIQGYFVEDESVPFSFNPMEQLDEPLLLIFDGLDELVMQGKTAQQSALDFISELKSLCNRVNSQKLKIKILIAGRPIAVQNTETRIRGSKEQFIYLLPYKIENPDHYVGGEQFLQEDQRDIWWNKFYDLKSKDELQGTGLAKELKHTNLDQVTAEPLLNYLIALAWFENPEGFDENTNLNEIYERLIRRVYNREYEPKSETHRILDPDKYFLILEEIAICAWHGGDVRVTTSEKIEKHIADRGLKKYLDEYKEAAKGGVSRLLTAFYFKKYGKEGSTGNEAFEFTHKSFGEYLTAKSIIELVKLIDLQIKAYEENEDHRFSAGWDRQRALETWLKVMGETTLDSDLVNFMQDEIRLREEKEKGLSAKWQLTFCHLIEEAAKTGMPPLKERDTPKEENRRSRNAKEALTVIVSLCSRVSENLSKIGWGDEGLSSWLAQLCTSLGNQDLAFQHLDRLNERGAILITANFWGANLSYSDFKDAEFSGSNLITCDLTQTNLENSSLDEANFLSSNLLRTNFKNADLNNASFINANLSEANFTGARNLTPHQLKEVFELFMPKGLSEELKQKLKGFTGTSPIKR